MSALHGDLTEFDVASVLSLLSDLRKTGELSFTGDRGSSLVGFDSGSIVWAECSSAPHSTAPADVVFELLRFKSAEFDFEALDRPARNRNREEVAPVLKSATTQLEEWRDIEQVVASGDVLVTLARRLPADEVVIRRSGWDLIHAIGTGETVTADVNKMELNELRVSRLVKELAEDGLIELNGRNLTDPESVETTKPEEAEPETELAAGAESDGAEFDGADSDGLGSDSSESDGADSDGADSDGADSDGADSDGAESDDGAAAELADADAETDGSAKPVVVGPAAASDDVVESAPTAVGDEAGAGAVDLAISDLAGGPVAAGGAADSGEPIEVDSVVFGDIPEPGATPGIDLVAEERQAFDELPPPPAMAGGFDDAGPAVGSDDLPPPPPALEDPPMVPITDAPVGSDAAPGGENGDSTARSRLDRMASELGLDIEDRDPVDLEAELRPSVGADSDLIEHQEDKGRWRPFRSRH